LFSRNPTETVAALPSTYRPATGEPARSGFGETAVELAHGQHLRFARPDHYLLQMWRSTAARSLVIDRGR
jgi:hypothetical protein